jgi:hypothetical protein
VSPGIWKQTSTQRSVWNMKHVTEYEKALMDRGIVGSNSVRDVDVTLFLCCALLCRYRPCDGPIHRPRSPTLSYSDVMFSQPTSLRLVLILSSHIHLGLPSNLQSRVLNKILKMYLSSS